LREAGILNADQAPEAAHRFKDKLMNILLPTAARLGALLKQRGDTIAVVDSSSGGLIAASLLAVPGASAYFLGGAVIYTVSARRSFGITDNAMRGLRSSSEPYAAVLARTTRERHGAIWGLAETGAAGPTGNRYGDASGHSCIAVDGPSSRVLTIETASSDRIANMRRFALTALETMIAVLEDSGKA
jgi:nicotinamide-nucleotide amidase